MLSLVIEVSRLALYAVYYQKAWAFNSKLDCLFIKRCYKCTTMSHNSQKHLLVEYLVILSISKLLQNKIFTLSIMFISPQLEISRIHSHALSKNSNVHD